MCEGVPLFSNNTTAKYGKKTSSHSDAAKALKIEEDEWRKFEYHFWDGTIPMDHYDGYSEELLKHIDPEKATKHAKALVNKHLKTQKQIVFWLKDVPSQFGHIRDIKDDKRRNGILKALFGMTEAGYKKKNEKRDKALQDLYQRIKNAPVFHPATELSKKEIQLKVDLSFDLLKLPKIGLDSKYINNRQDYANAYVNANAYANAYAYANAHAYADAYANANADAYADADAYANANAYANSYANSKWWYRLYSARCALFMSVEYLPKKYRVKTKQYKGNPFMPIFELFEMGLWPVGTVDNKFRIYIPTVNGKRPVIK